MIVGLLLKRILRVLPEDGLRLCWQQKNPLFGRYLVFVGGKHSLSDGCGCLGYPTLVFALDSDGRVFSDLQVDCVRRWELWNSSWSFLLLVHQRLLDVPLLFGANSHSLLHRLATGFCRGSKRALDLLHSYERNRCRW